MAAVRHIRVMPAAGLPTSVIAQLLDCVHDDGGRMVPSGCQGMAGNLRRERRRIAESIERLQPEPSRQDGSSRTHPVRASPARPTPSGRPSVTTPG
ncbi:hypothetical protein [Nonomuraea longispora]|uniref:hypothetical protein n=1 Tax=Nonomuraea longispora TaxID=1848320 RepID=UPI0015F2C875|nr:hypothetical protein [Nonomuraea longispora]